MFTPDESNLTPYQKAQNAVEYEIGRNGLEYVDNVRIAREGDEAAWKQYHRQIEQGCCGFFDTTVVIDGVKWYIGCNHGH